MQVEERKWGWGGIWTEMGFQPTPKALNALSLPNAMLWKVMPTFWGSVSERSVVPGLFVFSLLQSVVPNQVCSQQRVPLLRYSWRVSCETFSRTTLYYSATSLTRAVPREEVVIGHAHLRWKFEGKSFRRSSLKRGVVHCLKYIMYKREGKGFRTSVLKGEWSIV